MSRVGRRGSWTLVELLVVVVILVALAAWLAPRYLGSGKSTPGRATVQAPVQRAHGVECANNLRQVRMAITMAQQTNEQYPANLGQLTSSGVSREMQACPVSKQAYVYDPTSGRVGCPYPPHRSY